MLHSLLHKKNLIGVFSDYQKCKVMLEGLIANNFVDRKNIEIKSFYENTILSGDYKEEESSESNIVEEFTDNNTCETPCINQYNQYYNHSECIAAPPIAPSVSTATKRTFLDRITFNNPTVDLSKYNTKQIIIDMNKLNILSTTEHKKINNFAYFILQNIIKYNNKKYIMNIKKRIKFYIQQLNMYNSKYVENDQILINLNTILNIIE